MNIEKLGDKIIEQLTAEGLVKRFSDLYRLGKVDLLKLGAAGVTSPHKIFSTASRPAAKPTLARFILCAWHPFCR